MSKAHKLKKGKSMGFTNIFDARPNFTTLYLYYQTSDLPRDVPKIFNRCTAPEP